jgi:hypothetical protein
MNRYRYKQPTLKKLKVYDLEQITDFINTHIKETGFSIVSIVTEIIPSVYGTDNIEYSLLYLEMT